MISWNYGWAVTSALEAFSHQGYKTIWREKDKSLNLVLPKVIVILILLSFLFDAFFAILYILKDFKGQM